MKYDNDVLSVTFCRDDNGKAGLAVFKELKNGKPCMIKMETGEQAYNLYFLLTTQSAKIEDIKVAKIEALEQEIVIDKIRAEIENINLNEVATKYEDRFYGFQREVLKILDKYK